MASFGCEFSFVWFSDGEFLRCVAETAVAVCGYGGGWVRYYYYHSGFLVLSFSLSWDSVCSVLVR